MKIECTEVLKGHTGKVWCVKWSPRGDLLASCGQDTTVRLWARASLSSQWKQKAVLKDAHQKTVREVAWSPCGRFLASASFDATTAVWDSLSGQFECNATLEGHENEVKSVSWSPSGGHLATCSRDKSVWIWEVETTDEYDCDAVLNAHSQDVKRVRWSPKGDVLASASYDDTIKLFTECPTTNDWTCAGTLKSHESTVWSVAFDRTGERLVSVSDDKTLKLWNSYKPGNPEGVATEDNFPTWKCVCTVSGQHDGPIYDVDWSHHEDSPYILTASGDNCIRIFAEETSSSQRNAPTLTMITSFHHAHEQDVNSVAWHPSEPGVFASASDDSTVKIWKLVED